MGQAWQKKGKRVGRGTKSEMSTTKGQSRERGRVNPGTSGMKEGVSKPCHEGLPIRSPIHQTTVF